MSDAPYSIERASARHIRPMAAHLRAAACITLQGYGYNPRQALHRAFIASFYCRTALSNGRPVAMWGVTGTLMSDVAFVWLVLSQEITKIPLSITRDARRELAKIMENYDEIATTVLPDDEAAIQFAVHLGFHDREGADAPGSRRGLAAAIKADPKHRIPVGDSYVIGLGYHAAGVH